MKFGVTAATAGAVLALAPGALAAPQANDQGLQELPATCDGVQGTVTHSQGASFWFNGSHYVVRSFTASFNGQELFGKTYGGGGGPTITCTSNDQGVDLTITAFPAP